MCRSASERDNQSLNGSLEVLICGSPARARARKSETFLAASSYEGAGGTGD